MHNIKSSRPKFSVIRLFYPFSEIPVEESFFSNDCCKNFTFNCQNPTFVATHSVKQLVLGLRPLIGSFAKTFIDKYQIYVNIIDI